MCGNIVMSVMCAHNSKHKRVEIETRSQSSFLSQFEIQDQQLHLQQYMYHQQKGLLQSGR